VLLFASQLHLALDTTGSFGFKLIAEQEDKLTPSHIATKSNVIFLIMSSVKLSAL
jgi:hypothetical protein